MASYPDKAQEVEGPGDPWGAPSPLTPLLPADPEQQKTGRIEQRQGRSRQLEAISLPPESSQTRSHPRCGRARGSPQRPEVVSFFIGSPCPPSHNCAP